MFASKLCHPIQRYKFESNSQQVGGRYWQSTGCVIRYKDTNLKAIHNTSTIAFATTSAVSSDTKIQIWKQFTTHQERLHGARKLCHPIQRYKFESNSQPLRNSTKSLSAVSSDTKIQIWKQFTTDVVPSKLHTKLCHPIQRYKFESNSQLNNFQNNKIMGCVIRYKDTNLKAIHNRQGRQRGRWGAVSSDTKIQIWKQFTTRVLEQLQKHLLCHPIQRYKFESNSQQLIACSGSQAGCVIRYKDTNLKAIHNLSVLMPCRP